MRRALRGVFGFGPLFAWDALMVLLATKREFDAAVASQRADGAR